MERILFVRQMILAKTKEERNNALSKILPYQKKDFTLSRSRYDAFKTCQRCFYLKTNFSPFIRMIRSNL